MMEINNKELNLMNYNIKLFGNYKHGKKHKRLKLE
jgi:hypothetical protein